MPSTMPAIMNMQIARRRRTVMLRGVAMAIAAFLPGARGDAPRRTRPHGSVGGIGNAAVPPRIVSLADYGGMPGAGRAVLVRAFGQALRDLAGQGGGTLFVPGGVYDFGTHADADTIILCRDARNIAISAYGAMFAVTTAANVMPNLFYFFNFQNITIAGASFTDRGFNPRVDWRGMYCVGIQADRPSRGFTMVDCYAERVVGMLASHNNAATRRCLSNIRVQGEVRQAYYGVGASFIRENVDVDLVCHNVRRAFIASALHNAEIRIRAFSTLDWPGSNGLVALICAGASAGNVGNVRVRMDVSGDCIHDSYVHFYHQGQERHGAMRNIDATVNLVNVRAGRHLFAFDHEADAILPSTARVWDRISLRGTIAGDFTGRVVANPSVSTSPGAVYLTPRLARRQF
jgi:hypothetical protein